MRLTVRLLVPGARTWTAELLGFAATVVGNEERSVELDEGLLELVLGVLVDVLLVVGDDGLSDGLADGVDLGDVATTGDANADIDAGELVEADDQDGLVDLFTQLVSIDSCFRYGSLDSLCGGFRGAIPHCACGVSRD